jgi:hypothetical protein
MFVRLGNCLLIVALLVATGGHWVVLQAIAWTNMFADNLRTTSFEEALTKTFDGKHPCKLCKSIDAGKSAEKRTELPQLMKQLEFVDERPKIVCRAPRDFTLLSETGLFLASFSYKPPVPPPRSLAV